MTADFTQAELLAVLTLDATDAAKHARCGPNARCRRDALARCDDDLDAYLAMAMPHVQDAPPRAQPR